MIYTDLKYIASTNPENDYAELFRYLKTFVSQRRRAVYRHDGVPYCYVRKNMILKLKMDSVYLCKTSEFDGILRGDYISKKPLKVNFKKLAMKNFCQQIFKQVCKHYGLTVHNSLIQSKVTKNSVKMFHHHVWYRTKIYYEFDDNVPYGRFKVEDERKGINEYKDIPEDIILKIKEKTTYLPNIL